MVGDYFPFLTSEHVSAQCVLIFPSVKQLSNHLTYLFFLPIYQQHMNKKTLQILGFMYIRNSELSLQLAFTTVTITVANIYRHAFTNCRIGLWPVLVNDTKCVEN